MDGLTTVVAVSIMAWTGVEVKLGVGTGVELTATLFVASGATVGVSAESGDPSGAMVSRAAVSASTALARVGDSSTTAAVRTRWTLSERQAGRQSSAPTQSNTPHHRSRRPAAFIPPRRAPSAVAAAVVPAETGTAWASGYVDARFRGHDNVEDRFRPLESELLRAPNYRHRCRQSQ